MSSESPRSAARLGAAPHRHHPGRGDVDNALHGPAGCPGYELTTLIYDQFFPRGVDPVPQTWLAASPDVADEVTCQFELREVGMLATCWGRGRGARSAPGRELQVGDAGAAVGEGREAADDGGALEAHVQVDRLVAGEP